MDFNINEAGLEAELMDHLNEELDRRLENAKAIAYRNCPVDTGLLRSTIRIEDLGDEKRLVYGSDEAYYAEYIEFGTEKMQAYHVLGNAADALTSDN